MYQYMLLLIFFSRECSEARAFAFAGRTDLITYSQDMPEDAKENCELVIDLLAAEGWTLRKKTPGNGPNGDNSGTAPAEGPKEVLLPVHWDEWSYRKKAEVLWHEFNHVRGQEDLGRARVHRLLWKRPARPHWRIALEVPATAQTIVVRAHHGESEESVRRFARSAVDDYWERMDLSRLRDDVAWEEFALDHFEMIIDDIFEITVLGQDE